MPRRRPLPYIRKLRQRGRVAVWLVDGAYVRTHQDIEFDNYAQHTDFDFIPPNEFWIDQEAHPDETAFYIERLAVERRLRRRGVAEAAAVARAEAAEKALREQAGDLKRARPSGRLPDPRQAHRRLWKRLGSGVSVWIVDGRRVRSVFDIDFTAGGHDHVYEFIPDNEVWIDDDMSDAERGYALVHELHERNKMKQGWTYARAHASANRVELRCRKHPNNLHDALSTEGWED
jgi:hypothetical protein